MSVAIMKSYDQVGVKEDISNIISNISPTKTPMLTMIGTESVHQRLYEWQEDSLIAAGDNAAIEGADAPSAVMNPTVMRDNTTQILTKTAKVAGSADETSTYGRDRELAYQLGLRSDELKRDLEYAMVGTKKAKVTGDDSTARKFANYLAQLDGTAVYTVDSTGGALNTAITSQTAAPLREDAILTVSQTLYTNGAEPNTLMVKPTDASVVAAMQSNGRTKYVENGQKNIVNVVDVYTSPFGSLKVMMDRFQLASSALVFDPANWKRVVFRNWFRKTLSVTGDSTNVQILGEFGMKHRNYAASGAVINLT